MGFQAGKALTDGDENVIIGDGAGQTTTSVHDAVIIGRGAAQNGNISSNANGTVAIGYKALESLTGAYRNIAIGQEAGKSITTSNDMLCIGHMAGKDASSTVTTAQECVYIGSFAGENIDDGVKNVAIGTEAFRGATDNGALADQNVAIGFKALTGVTDGDTNVAIGYECGDAITEGYQNVGVGGSVAFANESTAVNQLVLGYGATGVANNTAIIGNGSCTDVYMGDNGNTWSQTSDGRLKENVKEWNKGLDEINKLRIVEFNFKKDNPFNYDSDKKRQGVIAQEAQEVLPENG